MNGNQECLAYAEHLQAGHRELHQRLRMLQRELNQVTAPCIDGPLLERMIAIGQRLRDDIAHHFGEEEDGGCMDYAVSRLPRLAPEALELEREHPQLMKTMDELLAQLRAAQPGELLVATIREGFENLIVRLLSHEASENRLVERGFNLSLE